MSPSGLIDLARVVKPLGQGFLGNSGPLRIVRQQAVPYSIQCSFLDSQKEALDYSSARLLAFRLMCLSILYIYLE